MEPSKDMRQDIYTSLEHLLGYAIQTGLMDYEDCSYVANRLFAVLKLSGRSLCVVCENLPELDVEKVLEPILDWAAEQGVLEARSPDYADLLDADLMGCLMPRPSETIRKFKNFYGEHPERATKYLYGQGIAANYIRMGRIEKNVIWKHPSEYGELDLTINLSKPEKDPKAIAAAKAMENTDSSKYPACLLCPENEGYAGRLDHPARQNLRLIPIELNDEPWYLQYSPYVYYNEHCIVLSEKHEAMKLSKGTFNRLLDFVALFPHYFIGSNADLPIVGGSILTHDHYQGGGYTFAMAKASVEMTYELPLWSEVTLGRVKWPMSVLRLTSPDKTKLMEVAWTIYQQWQSYSDPDADIVSHTAGVLHNTVTPIARYRDGAFEVDLVLRNNRTTATHPDGLFHPHEELHHIKKENIGLIEVMGLAVLPGRLALELKKLADHVMQASSREVLEQDPDLKKHGDWYESSLKNYAGQPRVVVEEVLRTEVGMKFEQVLSHAGVFKRTSEGMMQFDRFVESIT